MTHRCSPPSQPDFESPRDTAKPRRRPVPSPRRTRHLLFPSVCLLLVLVPSLPVGTPPCPLSFRNRVPLCAHVAYPSITPHSKRPRRGAAPPVPHLRHGAPHQTTLLRK